MTHSDLIQFAAKWLRNRGCGVVITELAAYDCDVDLKGGGKLTDTCQKCIAMQAQLDALHKIVTVELAPDTGGYFLAIPILGPNYRVYGDTLVQAVDILKQVVTLQQGAQHENAQADNEALKQIQDVLDEVKEKRRR